LSNLDPRARIEEDFLARNGLLYQYTIDDLNQDRENLERIR